MKTAENEEKDCENANNHKNYNSYYLYNNENMGYMII
jgi:hypothetical protein